MTSLDMMKVCHTTHHRTAGPDCQENRKNLSDVLSLWCHSAPAVVMKPNLVNICLFLLPSQPAAQQTVESHLVGGRHGSQRGEVGRQLGQRRSRARHSGHAGWERTGVAWLGVGRVAGGGHGGQGTGVARSSEGPGTKQLGVGGQLGLRGGESGRRRGRGSG